MYGKKITAMSAPEFATLALKCCVFIGCPPPSAEQIILLHAFLSNNFKRETDQSLFKAFELNASGQLSERVQHYQSFDAHFVGALLGEFELKHRECVKDCLKVEPQEENLLPAFTDDGAMLKIYYDHLAEIKQKGSSNSAVLLGSMMFDWLEKRGEINVKDDDLRRVKAKAFESVRLENEIGKTTIERWKSDPQFKRDYDNFKDKVVSESKRILYIEHLIKNK